MDVFIPSLADIFSFNLPASPLSFERIGSNDKNWLVFLKNVMYLITHRAATNPTVTLFLHCPRSHCSWLLKTSNPCNPLGLLHLLYCQDYIKGLHYQHVIFGVFLLLFLPVRLLLLRLTWHCYSILLSFSDLCHFCNTDTSINLLKQQSHTRPQSNTGL